MKVRVLFATGFEEVEALTVVDILRRAGVDCSMVATDDKETVTGARGMEVVMDEKLSEIEGDVDLVVLPGGIPGVPNLKANPKVAELVKSQYEAGRYVAAICAGPTALSDFGVLKGKKACCYPGLEGDLDCANAVTDSVVVDGNVITSRGVGTAIEFGLKLTEILKDKETADQLGKAIVYYN